MKIAIFHNYMDNIGGAELVTLTLARELNADVYTTNIDQKKISKLGFPDVKIKSIGKVPKNAPFRQQMASLRFLMFKAKGYDFHIITGDWAVSGAVKNKPNMWYVHAPTRELWDLYEYTKSEIVQWYWRPFFSLWATINRLLSKTFVKHAERIVCNSDNTKKRVKKYLNRKGVVIYPPVNINAYRTGGKGDYWLSVNRLVRHKRVEMQFEAMKLLPDERLVIVGSYEDASHFLDYKKQLEETKPNNVELLHFVNHKDLIDLYAGCKGFITTSKDEDFGLTVVEAMASGKPVIAPNEGGYRETVINGKTGILIENINPVKLAQAMEKISRSKKSFGSACRERAKMFSVKRFADEIKKVLEIERKY